MQTLSRRVTSKKEQGKYQRGKREVRKEGCHGNQGMVFQNGGSAQWYEMLLKDRSQNDNWDGKQKATSLDWGSATQTNRVSTVCP